MTKDKWKYRLIEFAMPFQSTKLHLLFINYDRLLPAVNNAEEYEDWYEEEDYYYQCMVCGKSQEKFNGGSCFLCASPVEKITF